MKGASAEIHNLSRELIMKRLIILLGALAKEHNLKTLPSNKISSGVMMNLDFSNI